MNQPVLRCLSEIEPRPIDWLWPGRIPHRKFTLLVGDPGLGKSLLSLYLCGCVTRRRPFTDGAACTQFGSVIVLSCEDDAADTLRPRLEAAKANLRLCHILEAVRVTGKGGRIIEKAFDLRHDLEALEAALIEHPTVRLIVIDPLSAYLGGIDSHKNSEVRSLLSPLAALAARFNVTIIGITHLSKANRSAIYRALDSIGFVAAARSVWAVAADPADAERRLLIPVKQNLAPNVGGLAFHIEAPNGVPRITWEQGPITTTADQALNVDIERRSKIDDAKEFLKEKLANGRIASKALEATIAREHLSYTTLRRARKELGVKHEKVGTRWFYTLDGNREQVEQVEIFGSQDIENERD